MSKIPIFYNFHLQKVGIFGIISIGVITTIERRLILYLNCLVDIPDAKGKITFRNKSGTDYVYYEYGRDYDSETQKTNPKRATIGKRSKADPLMMQPNDIFLKFFPDAELPEEFDRSYRSSCLRIGDYVLIRRILLDYKLPEILGHYFEGKDLGLFLDLAAYSIVTENNAGQYYPGYAYNHPLFTQDMKIYSDSRVSDFLHSITEDQCVEFLNEWNESRDHREKIYISYDSTNKACQAGDIEIVEYGHPKVDQGLPIFNYAVAYDTSNREPLFYDKYPGSINDVSQLEFMLETAYGYGYRKVGFILDRGYFSKSNFDDIDAKGYSFVIMVKGMADFVNAIVRDKKGLFEKKRINYIDEFDLYGTTVKTKLYVTDEKDRYVHVYYGVQRESAENRVLEDRIRQMKKYLKKHENEVKQFGSGFEKYFLLHYNDENSVFQFAEEKTGVIDDEISLCGYFCIVTSEKMTAKEAITLYKSRDDSEKLFRGDKSYLGNKSLRTSGDEAAGAKIFIEFIALIIRNRIYTCLKKKMKEMDKKPNYMTVPAALKELEKIEMIRHTDNIYRMDHPVTKTQKEILSAFGIDAANVKYRAEEIGKMLSTGGKYTWQE